MLVAEAHVAVVAGMRAHGGSAEVQEWGMAALCSLAAGSRTRWEALMGWDARGAGKAGGGGVQG